MGLRMLSANVACAEARIRSRAPVCFCCSGAKTFIPAHLSKVRKTPRYGLSPHALGLERVAQRRLNDAAASTRRHIPKVVHRCTAILGFAHVGHDRGCNAAN